MNCLLVMPQAEHLANRLAINPGLAVISAAMKKCPDLKVFNLNLNNSMEDDGERQQSQIAAIIKEEKIEAVLSGGYWVDWRSMRLIFEAAKRYDPSLPTITGGALLSGDPPTIMEALEFADYGVIGEGEHSVVELCRALKNRGAPETIRGLIIKTEKGYLQTAPRSVITDWREIPWADYDGFDYAGMKAAYGALSGEKMSPLAHGNRLFVPTGRGCPYRCTFCRNSDGGGYRPRPLDDFFRELSFRLSKYEQSDIGFADDLLCTSKDRLREFCAGMNRLDFRNWVISMRVSQVDDESAELLAAAGCGLVALGLESASDLVLKSMRKKITLAQTEKALASLKKAGLGFSGGFIFGDTAETFETAAQTLDWWEAHPEYSGSIALGRIVLFPGSTLYKKAVDEGRIKNPVSFLKEGLPPINISKMSDEQWATLLRLIHQVQCDKGHDPAHQPRELAISYDLATDLKTVRGFCSTCGQALEARVPKSTHNSFCPHCYQRFRVPVDDQAITDLRAMADILANNVDEALKQYREIAFWGIGNFFHRFVDMGAAWLQRPEIRFVDSFQAGLFEGSKRLESPEIIREQGIDLVIIAIAPNLAYNQKNAAYSAVEAKLMSDYQPRNIVGLYQLLSKKMDFTPTGILS